MPGPRLLLRLAPLVAGALAAAVWLERRWSHRPQLGAPAPAPDRLEPVAAPEPVDIVTVVDDLLTAGR